MKFGIFMAPFHRAGENPTLCFERDLELIEWLDRTGYDEVSLTSLSTADFSCIAPLIKKVTDKLAPENVSLGVSSLRAYGLGEDVLDDPHGRVVVEGHVDVRGRFGDPGLASRLTQLEMNFRRLLACPPTSLGDAEKAPAGPGVWVLTDSDLSTYYYVEPCQTLRVAIPHLLRSSAARRGESIKPRLAEHLGIPESRVAKYLSEHCVVRWLQMDEDAAHFAHFLIAVLRPTLNE